MIKIYIFTSQFLLLHKSMPLYLFQYYCEFIWSSSYIFKYKLLKYVVTHFLKHQETPTDAVNAPQR